MPDTYRGLTISFGQAFEIDAVNRRVRCSLEALATGPDIATTYVDANGTVLTQKIDVVVASRLTSDFSTQAAASDLAVMAGASPASVAYVDSDACLQLSASAGRVHTAWNKFAGDGLYRVLLRLNRDDTPVLDRRVGLAARVRTVGPDWYGVRLELYETGGARKIHLREYTGSGGTTTSLATAAAEWDYETWQWFELEVVGTTVRGRIYSESESAPAWQVTATVSEVGAGAFGPHLFPAKAAKIVDIREISAVAAL